MPAAHLWKVAHILHGSSVTASLCRELGAVMISASIQSGYVQKREIYAHPGAQMANPVSCFTSQKSITERNAAPVTASSNNKGAGNCAIHLLLLLEAVTGGALRPPSEVVSTCARSLRSPGRSTDAHARAVES